MLNPKMNSNNKTNRQTEELPGIDNRLVVEVVENSVENFTPHAYQLQGLPYEIAELYGKPNVNARYLRDDSDCHSYWGDCSACEQLSQGVVQLPIREWGRNFLLMTPAGRYVLKPSLMAMCDLHGLDFQTSKIRWRWYDSEYARLWWNGEILKHIEPHSPRLYSFGEWDFG